MSVRATELLASSVHIPGVIYLDEFGKVRKVEEQETRQQQWILKASKVCVIPRLGERQIVWKSVKRDKTLYELFGFGTGVLQSKSSYSECCGHPDFDWTVQKSDTEKVKSSQLRVGRSCADKNAT